ncbi:hypothetical protein ACFQV4_27845 [Streptomyces thermocarboxydus]
MWIASNLFGRFTSDQYDEANDPQAIHDAAGWLMAGRFSTSRPRCWRCCSSAG